MKFAEILVVLWLLSPIIAILGISCETGGYWEGKNYGNGGDWGGKKW